MQAIQTERTVVRTDELSYGFSRKLLAWAVHLFTASGFVIAFLGILAIQKHNWRLALFCMAMQLVIDALDGTMARALNIDEVLPRIKGAVLDSMSDFLNHVLVPTLLLYESNLVPENLAFATSAAMLLASAFHWANVRAVTEDNYIEGFPSMWNMVVVYLFLFNFSQWINLAVVLIFFALHFLPIKYVYVSKTKHLQTLTRVLTALWAVFWAIILLQFPATNAWLVWASLFYLIYLSVLGLHRTLRGAAVK